MHNSDASTPSPFILQPNNRQFFDTSLYLQTFSTAFLPIIDSKNMFVRDVQKEKEELKKIACQAIDQHSQELHELNKNIWENPELCYKEVKSHGFLTEFFQKNNFDVTQPSSTLETAFSARYGGNDGVCVGIICEYDAQRDKGSMGHTCGHNLIAEAGAAAALGIQAALDKTGNKLGKLLVLGAPGESGGKVKMLENGCFEGVDFCMMVHPGSLNLVCEPNYAYEKVEVICDGKSPGVHAFAAFIANTKLIFSSMTEQMKPPSRVDGFTHEDVDQPKKITMEYDIRAPNKKDLKVLEGKVVACFEDAAKATGCTCELKWNPPLLEVKHNPCLADLYRTNAESLGITFLSKEEELNEMATASTDFGNVSYAVPSIHPSFSIDTTATNRSHEFTAAAATYAAHEKSLIAAKALAMTAIDVMSDPTTLQEMKNQFKRTFDRKLS